MENRIIHPTRRVTKHYRVGVNNVKLGTQHLSEADLLMIPNIGELRFKKVVFDVKRWTQEQVKEIVTLWVRELINAYPDYVYHAIKRLQNEDHAAVFITVFKHKDYVNTQTSGK